MYSLRKSLNYHKADELFKYNSLKILKKLHYYNTDEFFKQNSLGALLHLIHLVYKKCYSWYD